MKAKCYGFCNVVGHIGGMLMPLIIYNLMH